MESHRMFANDSQDQVPPLNTDQLIKEALKLLIWPDDENISYVIEALQLLCSKMDDLEEEQCKWMDALFENGMRQDETGNEFIESAITLFEAIQLWRREQRVSAEYHRSIEKAAEIARSLRNELISIALLSKDTSDISKAFDAINEAFDIALQQVDDVPYAVEQFVDTLGISMLDGLASRKGIESALINLSWSLFNHANQVMEAAEKDPGFYNPIVQKFKDVSMTLDNLALLDRELKNLLAPEARLQAEASNLEEYKHLVKKNMFSIPTVKANEDLPHHQELRRSNSFTQ